MAGPMVTLTVAAGPGGAGPAAAAAGPGPARRIYSNQASESTELTMAGRA